MSIRIVKAGILDTVQDEGRFGQAQFGINTNGAMDQFAFQSANALVGNPLSYAVLELHFPAAEIYFEDNSIISITGGDFTPTLNGLPIPCWKTVNVPADSFLRFQTYKAGMRCYLAIHGGFVLNEWMGSKSTNLRAQAGGWNGRRLLTNDIILKNEGIYAPEKNTLRAFPWSVNHRMLYESRRIRMLTGSELEWLARDSQINLFSYDFTVTSRSDRMASFLDHEPLAFEKTDQLLSGPVAFGTIQALPEGKLCILMADHQTTGGYPKVGHVITSDLPIIAQLTAGDKFNFVACSLEEAEKSLLAMAALIRKFSTSIKENLKQAYGVR